MTTDPTGPAPARSASPAREPAPAAAPPAVTTGTGPAGGTTGGTTGGRAAGTTGAGSTGGTSGGRTAAPGRPPGTGFTRASAAWVAVAVSLLFLVLLIVFILQNGSRVAVSFLGFSGSLPLGVALLIAAVVGGIVVAVAGAARVVQLRHAARRAVRG